MTKNSENVEHATYVAANLELANPEFFTTTFTPSQIKVLTQVDSIKWTIVGDSSMTKAEMSTPRSTLIDAMLASCMPAENGVRAPFIKVIGAQS